MPLFLATLGLAARLWLLGDKPLWYDEALTLKRAALTWAELASDSFHNKHYPLYFLLTKPFAGEAWSEAGLRLPAAVFGTLAVLLVARIAFELGGRWAGLVAGVLMALSPLEVQYGQEARPYTIASAAILLALWGLMRLFEPDDDGDRPAPRWADWTVYGFGMAVAVNALGVASAGFVAVNVLVCGLGLARRLPQRISAWRWIGINVLIVVVWLPALVSMLAANAGAATRGLNWIPPLSLELARNVLGSLYMLQLSDLMTFERLAPPVPLLGLAVVVLAGAGAMAVRRSPRGIILIGLTLAMPVGAALISIGKPIFVPRYLLWSTGPYFILAGIGVAEIAPVLLRAAVSGLLAAGAAVSLEPYYAAETKPRWDLAAAYLATHGKTGDATVVSSGLARSVLATYLTRRRGAPGDLLAVRSRGDVVRAYGSGATVWLVHGRAGQGGRLMDREAFTRQWPEFDAARDSVSIGRHITIWRYTPPEAAR